VRALDAGHPAEQRIPPCPLNLSESQFFRGGRRARQFGSLCLVGLCITQAAQAQNGRDPWDRYDRNGRYDAYTPLAQLDRGTFITVRTRQSIDTDRRGDRVFSAVVENDVWDDLGRLAIPAIPRGAPAELFVRSARDGDLILDLESVTVGHQRYALSAGANRIEAPEGNAPASVVGGSAILGTIIGAIAGGGKGAAIGAAAGAAAGVGLLTRGRFIRVPAGSVVTFRLERSLSVVMPVKGGYDRRH
jgi:hypothetical protein